jgi:hypothetical protein
MKVIVIEEVVRKTQKKRQRLKKRLIQDFTRKGILRSHRLRHVRG